MKKMEKLENWKQEIMKKYDNKIKRNKNNFDKLNSILEEIEEARKVWGYVEIRKEKNEYYGVIEMDRIEVEYK